MASRHDAKIIWTGPSPRGWHRLQLAAECLQKYAWHYEAPKAQVGMSGRPALARGALVHLALAQHYARMRARQQNEPEDEWCEPEEAVELVAKLEGIEEHVLIVLRTFRRYVEFYENDEADFEILGVEEMGSTKIAGKYLLTGRRDLTVRDRSQRVFVWDHKTTSRLTARHKQFYAISGQLLGYGRMARERYGEAYAGMSVNLIELVAKDGERSNFSRVVLERSPNLESRFERIVVDVEEAIERLQASGRPYDDWPKAINELTCFHRYGACEHINRCRYGAGAAVGGNWVWSDQ